jgi:NAD(P)-dependent dehydrogenase (short-subunit alcohol dehydrogenase family)
VDDPLDFTDKVVLVTGGAAGVGRGIVDRFVQLGASVVTCGRTCPVGAAAGAEVGGAGFIACDVRDPDRVEALVAAVVDRHGALDVVVNNAGGSPAAHSATASARFAEAIVRLNLLAPLFVAQAANHVMQAQASGGSIINITSVSGLRPSPRSAAYGAAKAGLINLTQTLAVEWAPKVRVNSVCPGIVRTEKSGLWYGDETGIARVAATVPLGRMGTPRDVGDACVFLASELAGFVSGANLLVHGGGELPVFLEAAEPRG